MPFIKERRMGVITLGISWIIVPVIAILMINSVYSVADVIIAIIISMVFHIIGVVYYAGYMEVMSGFNTMDSKERSKYDRYRVTKFMGISFVIAGLGFALGSIFISAMGMSDGTIVGFLVLLAIIFPACIYLTCSKRFLKQ